MRNVPSIAPQSMSDVVTPLLQHFTQQMLAMDSKMIRMESMMCDMGKQLKEVAEATQALSADTCHIAKRGRLENMGSDSVCSISSSVSSTPSGNRQAILRRKGTSPEATADGIGSELQQQQPTEPQQKDVNTFLTWCPAHVFMIINLEESISLVIKARTSEQCDAI